jgi:prepilin signal peptidase PulO-like enzyme (type II secretory pathway)
MKSKPSWPLFIAWSVFYTVLDMILEYVIHGFVAWSQVPEAVEGALFGAAVTWLFALYRWHKSDAGL